MRIYTLIIRHLQITFIVIFLFQMYSCTKEASNDVYVKLPEYKQKLVINAFISSDQIENKIFISSTMPRFGERRFIDPRPLKLFLYEESNEINIDTVCKSLYGREHYYYIKNFKFKEGLTYSLQVKSGAGFEAMATCKIPVKHNFDIKVDTSSKKITDENGRILIIPYARISIKDFPGEPNYYRLLFTYDEFNSTKGSLSNKESFSNKLLLADPVTPVWQPSIGDVMHNDVGRDGQRIILRTIEFNSIDVDQDILTESDSSFLKIYLLSTDKPYNDFHLSLHNYTTGEDPFTEPSFLYSNIKGGIGIFASYVIDSLLYKLK